MPQGVSRFIKRKLGCCTAFLISCTGSPMSHGPIKLWLTRQQRQTPMNCQDTYKKVHIIADLEMPAIQRLSWVVGYRKYAVHSATSNTKNVSNVH